MGCLTAIFKLIFDMLYAAAMLVMYLITFLFMTIKFIVTKIIQANKNKKQNSAHNQRQYPKATSHENAISITKDLTNRKNITNSYSYLKIYIDKKHTGLRKNNELNYKMLGIESYDAPTVYYDDYAEVKGYNVFEADECSSEKYGNLLNRIHILCGNDFYATIGYEQDKVEYRITVKDNNIYINGNNVEYMKNRYMSLQNKIITFSDNLYERLMYIEDDQFYIDVVPNDDLDCDSITSLAEKLKDSNEILMFEIPYMEEISYIIDIIEPKIIDESNKGLENAMNSLPDIGVIEENDDYFEETIINKTKRKAKTWREEEFDREAELWGLSEEDKKIAREEGMTPADFIEAEEYDDDELLLDEWERW